MLLIKKSLHVSMLVLNHYTIYPKKPVKVVLFNEDKFPIIRFSPAIKSLNYLGNMLAKTEAEKLGYFEPLFYNKDKGNYN